MSVTNPHASEPIGSVREMYDGALYPDIAVSTFRNIDRLFPTRVVHRGKDVFPLPSSKNRLDNFTFLSGDQKYDLFDFLALGRVSGIIAIRDGQVTFEEYFLGNTQETRWMSMSVVKSISSMLVGAAIHEGHIQSIDDNLVRYLPQFRNTAYDGVTVKHLLQMASGAAWNETYTDRNSDRRAMLEAQIEQQPGRVLELMAALPRVAEPGTKHNYSTGETHVVGALVAAATGRNVADYLSERIWARFGMESEATWWLESPDGLEVGGSGLSATLRDFARFGMFLLNDGCAGSDRILPEGWVKEASSPQMIGGEKVDYGYMLWPMANNAYAALGIFGQIIYIRPDRNVVVAVNCANPKPMDRPGIDRFDFLNAIGEAIP